MFLFLNIIGKMVDIGVARFLVAPLMRILKSRTFAIIIFFQKKKLSKLEQDYFHFGFTLIKLHGQFEVGKK